MSKFYHVIWKKWLYGTPHFYDGKLYDTRYFYCSLRPLLSVWIMYILKLNLTFLPSLNLLNVGTVTNNMVIPVDKNPFLCHFILICFNYQWVVLWKTLCITKLTTRDLLLMLQLFCSFCIFNDSFTTLWSLFLSFIAF